jgi:hypothetical protein
MMEYVLLLFNENKIRGCLSGNRGALSNRWTQNKVNFFKSQHTRHRNIHVTEIYQKKEIIIETVEYERKLDSDTI